MDDDMDIHEEIKFMRKSIENLRDLVLAQNRELHMRIDPISEWMHENRGAIRGIRGALWAIGILAAIFTAWTAVNTQTTRSVTNETFASSPTTGHIASGRRVHDGP